MGNTNSSLLRPQSTPVVLLSTIAVGAIGYGVVKLYIPTKQQTNGNEVTKPGRKLQRGIITGCMPSRLIPIAGLVSWCITFGGSLGMSLYFGHDRKGLALPYISDCAKHSPERAFFSFGSTVTSLLMSMVCILNYGKVMHDMRNHSESNRCTKRNLVSSLCGAIGSPFLGLLACFDTLDNPRMHMVMVLTFFPCILVWMYSTLSVYKQMLALRTKNPCKEDDRESLQALQTSVSVKRLLATINSVSVSLYLPVGMSLVSDWYDYSNDFAVHQARAVFQHVSVACIVLYYASFCYDFGDLQNNFVTYSPPRAGGEIESTEGVVEEIVEE